MATISQFHAVVSFKGIRASGFLGWLMWLFVHLTFLTGFKNRFSALFHWASTFLAGGRAAADDHAPSGDRTGRHRGGGRRRVHPAHHRGPSTGRR